MKDSGGYDDNPSTADFYDQVVPYRERADISFYVNAATEAGSPVLELGCGTGRILIPMARAGVEIVGIDASSHILAVCRKRLVSQPKEVQDRVHIVHADMRSLDLSNTFTLVTTPFRSFQHLLTPEDQVAFLQAVFRHLKPEGRLILDFFNPSLEALIEKRPDKEFGEKPPFEMPNGREVVRKHPNTGIDRFHQIIDAELIHHVTHSIG